MKRRFQKYISKGMIAALLLTAIPQQMVVQADFGDGNVEEYLTIDTLEPAEIGLETSNTSDDDLPDNDELFEGYVNKTFGSGNIMLYSSLAGDRLTGNEKILYNFLKEQIAKVASGEISDTNFQMKPSSFIGYQERWTEEELGVPIVVNGELNQNAVDAIKSKMPCDFDKVSNAIMSDFPYELYWYNKTLGRLTAYAFTYLYDPNGSYVRLSDGSAIAFY